MHKVEDVENLPVLNTGFAQWKYEMHRTWKKQGWKDGLICGGNNGRKTSPEGKRIQRNGFLTGNKRWGGRQIFKLWEEAKVDFIEPWHALISNYNRSEYDLMLNVTHIITNGLQVLHTKLFVWLTIIQLTMIIELNIKHSNGIVIT